MISLGHQLLSRKLTANVGNPVTFNVGNAVEYVQIINYSDYILNLNFEGKGNLEFPPRYKADILVKPTNPRGLPVSSPFDGILIITPQIYNTLDVTSLVQSNPVSQPYAFVAVNGFAQGELLYPQEGPIGPQYYKARELSTQQAWSGAAGMTVSQPGVKGLSIVVDSLDVSLVNANTSTIDFTLTLSYTLYGAGFTFINTYTLEGSASTTQVIADHFIFPNGGIATDPNTLVSLAATTSATIGAHSSSAGFQFHFEYAF